jgi:type IV pilus assembly protein PilC
MTLFAYTATDVDGKQVKARIDAASEADARKELLVQNLDVRELKEHTSFLHREIGGQSVSKMEILHFSRQLGAFVKAGLTVVDGLEIIARSTANKAFAARLRRMRDDVREGMQFDEALAEHQSILPRYYLGVVRSAELTGNLDVALDQLSGYMERELEARSKIKSAMTYPLVIIGMAAVSVLILTVWVLPKFVELFKELKTGLPLSTRLIINFSNFSRDYWYIYVVLAGLVACLVWWVRNTAAGRTAKDTALLHIPIVRDIVTYAAVERVCRILATMWQAGVPIADSMAAAVQGADNAVFEARLAKVQEAVLAGEGLAEPLALARMFPDAAMQMIDVGEATGTLAEQLTNAADFYSRELDYKLKRLTSLFEPAIIVIVGLVVGFVALSLVQAMYGSLGSNQLKQ